MGFEYKLEQKRQRNEQEDQSKEDKLSEMIRMLEKSLQEVNVENFK